MATLLLAFAFSTVLASEAAAQGPPVASHAPTAGANPNAVVARVNGVPITNAEVDEELTTAGAAGHARMPKLAAEVRRRALEELIEGELIYQDAKKKGVRLEPVEIERALGQARKQAASSGTREEKALRRKTERGLMIEKVTALEMAAHAPMSETELRRYYREQRERLRKPEQVLLRAILAALPPSPKPEERTAARQTIEKVRAELSQGADFAALAQKYSGDAYRTKGGLIGWVHRGRLDPEIEKVAFDLPVGNSSAPFETKYGFSIVKVEGKHPARQLTYGEAKGRLRAELKQQKMAAAREAWINELKKNARIEYLAPRSS